jgi:biotin carboxyl carrier protein
MNNKFQTKVNGQYEFNFDKKDILDTDIQEISESKFNLIQNHKSHNVQVLKKDYPNKYYVLKVNSNVYKVNISDDLDILITELGLEAGKASQENDIKAPMPGLILEITASEGQEVKEGEAIMVLEAMKMENTITSPKDGVIKSIGVEKGQSVAKNELLIEFE